MLTRAKARELEKETIINNKVIMNVQKSDIIVSGGSSEGFEINNQLGESAIYNEMMLDNMCTENTRAMGLDVVVVDSTLTDATTAIDLQMILAAIQQSEHETNQKFEQITEQQKQQIEQSKQETKK